MHVLVTGGAGYIGSHAALALRSAGLVPVVFDNLSKGHREAARFGPFVEGDLADQPLIERTLREHSIGAVMHFAASAEVGESMTAPHLYFRNNAVHTLHLLDAMRSAGVRRIVFSSTCAVYGAPAGVPIAESAPQHPLNPYGESKRMAESMIEWYGEAFGFQWSSLRYFNAAGAAADGSLGEDHDPEPHLIPRVIQAALGNVPVVEIFGTDYDTPDGTAVRDYVHVDDLASAHLAALRYLEAGGASGAFNLGTGRGCSVREVIAMVERVSGRRVPAAERERRAGDPAVLVADASRAGAELGWRPRESSLERIVETAWRWAAR